MKRNKMAKTCSIMMIMVLSIMATSLSTLAADPVPQARINADNSVIFSNLDHVALNEGVEFKMIDNAGNAVRVGVTLVASEAKAGMVWKVWYTSGVITANFYMNVDNNKVTSVYDERVTYIGGTLSNIALTKTSTYGKLSFKVTVFPGIASSLCWLKGTITGSNNNITVSWSM